MTSMLDQFEGELIKKYPDKKETTTSGYITLKTKSEMPIFSKSKMNLNLPNNIMYMHVASDWLILLMTNYTILRMNLKSPDKFTEVPIEKYIAGLKINNIYVDPLGAHLFISLSPKTSGLTSEVLYLNRNGYKPKTISKLKDYEITSVAFNQENATETSTGLILFGTSKGVIIEAEIGYEGGDKISQNNIRQVFDVMRPIIGIEYSLSKKSDANRIKCIVLVLTSDRLYKFHDKIKANEKQSVFQMIFNSYLNIPDELINYDAINGKSNSCKLICNYSNGTMKSFACSTESGLKYYEIDKNIEGPDFVDFNETIEYPILEDMENVQNSYKVQQKTNIPISCVLTDFHVLLLYSDHVTAVSVLNHQVVYEEYFVDQHGRLMNILKDVKSNITYLYSNKFIFRYKINNEQRNAWRMYAERNKFDLALKYCNDNPANVDIVLNKKAESLFEICEYMEAAEIYSRTQTSFEEVCLKFLQKNENDSLMLYLKNRLNRCKTSEKTQITMLVVWLVELYLIEIARFSENIDRVKELQQDFDEFMKIPYVVECIAKNHSVIYDLMASHGDNYNLTALTTFNKDYESAINQYIIQKSYADALKILVSQDRSDLFYKYCPILMEELPVETIKAIITNEKRLKLDPTKMIPSLGCFETQLHVAKIVEYLEHCIYISGCQIQAIQNFLIQLYSQHFPDKICAFLETQGNDINLVSYDVHYALRVSLSNDIKDASVFLYCLMEMWTQAVELALSFDTKLAHITASKPTDKTMRKKLWLIIAKKGIQETGNLKDNVQGALTILKDCDLLKIEDLLPYFSDFQKIDHFKEAICESLKEYNIKIQDQRRDMEESAKSAEQVRNELQTFRSRSVAISSQEQCVICGVYLLLKPFFIFQCGHKFHGECLEKQLYPLLNQNAQLRLNELKQKLATDASTTVNNYGLSNGNKEKIKTEIEEILSSECLFCGEIMIQMIDKSFTESKDQENEW